jgi:hypothetical protein
MNYSEKAWTDITNLTCEHCGHTGRDVKEYPSHTGSGVTWSPQCSDVVKCWERWDKQHSLKHTPAIQLVNMRRLNLEVVKC